MFAALDWFYNETLIRTRADLIAELTVQYLPTAVYSQEPNLPEGAVGLVCQGLSCQEPARDPEQLKTQVQQSQTRGFTEQEP
jgi:hypothetical protein